MRRPATVRCRATRRSRCACQASAQYAPDRAIPEDYRTTAYPCTAKHGYAWVALEDPIEPFRNDTEADCPAQLLIDFDQVITREDKEILESTDPDALVDTRRHPAGTRIEPC